MACNGFSKILIKKARFAVILTALAGSALVPVRASFAMPNAQDSIRPSEAWLISDLHDPNNATPPYCTLTRQFAGDVNMTIAQNKDDEYSLAIEFPNALFDRTQQYTMMLDAQDGQGVRFDMAPASEKAVVFRFGADASLLKAVEKTHSLSLSVNDQSYRFYVEDMAAGRKMIASCLQGEPKPFDDSSTSIVKRGRKSQNDDRADLEMLRVDSSEVIERLKHLQDTEMGYKNNLNSMEDHVDGLLARKEALERELNQIESHQSQGSTAMLEQRVKELEALVAQSSNAQDDISGKILAHKQELDALLAEKAALDLESQTQKASLDVFKEKEALYTTKIAKLEAKIQKLEGAQSQVVAASDATTQANQSRLLSMQKELKKAQLDLAAERSKIASLEKKIFQNEGDVPEIAFLKTLKTELQQNLKIEQQKKKAAEKELASLKLLFDHQKKSMATKLDAQTQQVDQLRKKISLIEGDNTQLQQKLAQVQDLNDQYGAQLADAASLAQIEPAAGVSAFNPAGDEGGAVTATAVKQPVELLKNRLDALTSENQLLNTKLQASDSVYQDRLAQIQGQIALLEQENESLSTQIAQAKAQKEVEIQSANASISDLKLALGQEQQEKSLLKKSLDVAMESLSQLKGQNLPQKITQLELQLQQKSQEKQKILADLEEQRALAATTTQAHAQELALLKDKIAKAELAATEMQKDSGQSELLKAQIDEVMTTKNTLQAQLVEKEKSLSDQVALSDRLQNQVVSMQTQLSDLNSKIQSAQLSASAATLGVQTKLDQELKNIAALNKVVEQERLKNADLAKKLDDALLNLAAYSKYKSPEDLGNLEARIKVEVDAKMALLEKLEAEVSRTTSLQDQVKNQEQLVVIEKEKYKALEGKFASLEVKLSDFNAQNYPSIIAGLRSELVDERRQKNELVALLHEKQTQLTSLEQENIVLRQRFGTELKNAGANIPAGDAGKAALDKRIAAITDNPINAINTRLTTQNVAKKNEAKNEPKHEKKKDIDSVLAHASVAPKKQDSKSNHTEMKSSEAKAYAQQVSYIAPSSGKIQATQVVAKVTPQPKAAKDNVFQLLQKAGFAVQGGARSGQAIRWQEGAIQASVQWVHYGDHANIANMRDRFLSTLKSSCDGDYAALPANSPLPRSQSALYETACVDVNDGEDRSASVLFLYNAGTMVMFSFESGLENYNAVINAQDRLSRVLR